MKSLFLVEDNQDNADLIRDLLGEDYLISLFCDGPSALAALISPGASLPDLFLLDISLPGMDGDTLLREIRYHDRLKNIHDISLTAQAMKSDRVIMRATGFRACW